MNEITLNVDGKIYRLTNQSNNNKFDRAMKEAGPNPSPKQILAHYHKHEGNIQDENGKKIESSTFWQDEKRRLEARGKLSKNIKSVGQITSHPVISAFVIIVILALLWYFLKIDLSRFY